MAVRFIGSAIKMDRFVPPFRNSYEIIIRKARTAMQKLAVDDTGIRTLYSALVKAGGAGADDHLFAANHYYVSGDGKAALEAVDAVLSADPDNNSAAMAKAVIMSGLGWRDESVEQKAAVVFAQVLGNGTVGEA
jgi:hypothetical protein